jgi:hypothetical protein
MKKNLLLIFVLLFSLSACDKSDDEGTKQFITKLESMVGKSINDVSKGSLGEYVADSSDLESTFPYACFLYSGLTKVGDIHTYYYFVDGVCSYSESYPDTKEIETFNQLIVQAESEIGQGFIYQFCDAQYQITNYTTYNDLKNAINGLSVTAIEEVRAGYYHGDYVIWITGMVSGNSYITPCVNVGLKEEK